MDDTTPPQETSPVQQIYDKPPEEPPPIPPTMVMPKHTSKRSYFLLFILIPILLLAIVVPAVMNSQSILSRAAGAKCRLITQVLINPGKIDTYANAQSTNLSVLAYDYYHVPIFEGVTYEWGMSSTYGVGTIKAEDDLAQFIPIRPGTGDLYVKAKNKCTVKAVIGSIKVTVMGIGIPVPTLIIQK
jgi:hypothetical protein